MSKLNKRDADYQLKFEELNKSALLENCTDIIPNDWPGVLVFCDSMWFSGFTKLDVRFKLPGNKLSDVDSFLENISDHDLFGR